MKLDIRIKEVPDLEPEQAVGVAIEFNELEATSEQIRTLLPKAVDWFVAELKALAD